MNALPSRTLSANSRPLGDSSSASTTAILEERAHALAREASNRSTRAAGTEVVVFRLGAEHYGIDASLVTGIHLPLPITPVPQTPDHFLGLASLRGELLPVFDLRKILGAGRTDVSQSGRLIVLGEEAADLGFPVDDVTGVRSLAKSSLCALPERGGEEAKRELICGVTAEALAVLDGRTLLNGPRTFVDLKS